jgi:hypothetical protein
MIPAVVAQFLGTILGKLAVGGGLAVLLLGMYGCEVHKQRKIGAEKALSRVEAKGKVLDAKASKARRAAERSVPDSLREWQRD